MPHDRRPPDPGTGGPGSAPPDPRGPLVETFLIAGAAEIPTRSVTDDVAVILAENGFDPASFEVLSWPTGASRHGRIRLLLAKPDYDDLKSAHPNWAVPLELSFAGSVWSKMYVLDQAVVAYSEATGPVYAVDVVDQRHWWGTKAFEDTATDPKRGFNVTTDDKEKFYEATTFGPDHDLYTYGQALADLFANLLPFASFAILGNSSRLNTSLGLKDFTVEYLSIPETIDRLCVLCGHVVLIDLVGLIYVRPIEGGAGDLDLSLEAGSKNKIITAGPAAVANAPPTDLHVRGLIYSPEWIARQNPASVKVIFPTALKFGAAYRWGAIDKNELGRDYVMGRSYAVSSTTGKPSGGDNGEEETVFDPEWAIMEPDPTGGGAPPTVFNQTDLEARANQVAAFLYGRLSSGAGRFKFSDHVDALYVGASMIHWSVVRYGPDQGVFTDVYGQVHDPILGYRFNDPITVSSILSIGGIRSLPRPDGGPLLDSPRRTRLEFVAKITEVNDDPANPGFNATYKAQAIDDETITIPRSLADFNDPSNPGEKSDTRPVVDPLDLIPRVVGDLCKIVIGGTPGGAATHKLWLWEQIDHDPCPTPIPAQLPPDPNGEGMLITTMGAF